MSTSEAWLARNHTVVTGRTRKGRTTQRVTRFGRASVLGAFDTDSDGRPLLAEHPDTHHLHPSTAAARMLLAAMERGEIGRTQVGLSTLDIDRITAAAYGDLIPPVQGTTDVRQYEQVIHRDRSAHAATTQHRCDIGGGQSHDIGTLWVSSYVDAHGARTARVVRDDTVAEIFAPAAANGALTDTSVIWPTRGTAGVAKFGRLAHQHRTGDPTTRRVFRVAPDGTCERVVLVVTATDDSEHLWDGHQLIARTPAIRTGGKRTKLAARTTVTADDPDVTVPTTRDGWATLIARLAPGERADLGHVTITYGKRGDRYSAVIRGDQPMRHQARTVQGLAAKLA